MTIVLTVQYKHLEYLQGEESATCLAGHKGLTSISAPIWAPPSCIHSYSFINSMNIYQVPTV